MPKVSEAPEVRPEVRPEVIEALQNAETASGDLLSPEPTTIEPLPFDGTSTGHGSDTGSWAGSTSGQMPVPAPQSYASGAPAAWANMGAVTALTKDIAAVPFVEDGTSFVATLGDIPMADLLRTVASGGKTGQITIRHDGARSRVWIVDGEVVDAESGPLTGEPAVYRILRVTAGELMADFVDVQRLRTVTRSLQGLLMHAAFREDERLALWERLVRTGSYCVREPDPMLQLASLPRGSIEARILELLDGRNGVALDALLKALGEDELDSLVAVDGLCQHGWVRMVSMPSAPADHDQANDRNGRSLARFLSSNGAARGATAPSHTDAGDADTGLLVVNLEEEAARVANEQRSFPTGLWLTGVAGALLVIAVFVVLLALL